MYQALYRKWRPSTFDEVVGQKHITEILKSQVKTGRLSHAYIFIGTRGTGKTTCARILAKAVNCEHPVDGNPCGCCPSCRGIADGSVLDVVELDAASNNGVDNVRTLREEAIFSPAQVKKRVYIVDEVHMLSTAAFNALLKILEEPPEHLMFILATTELQKVPATILSRCQRHTFKRIESSELSDYLGYIAGQEHFTLSHDAATLIARLAEGGVRDALSLLDQCSAYEQIDVDTVYSAMGLAGNRRIATLWDAVLRKDTASALAEFKTLWMDGKDPVGLLTELSNLLRDTLVLRVAPAKGSDLISGGNDIAVLKNFNKRMTTDELLACMDTLQTAIANMRLVANPKTAAELCLVTLCNDTLSDSIASLRARISALEETVKSGTLQIAATPAVVPQRDPVTVSAERTFNREPEPPRTVEAVPTPVRTTEVREVAAPAADPTPPEAGNVPVPVAPKPAEEVSGLANNLGSLVEKAKTYIKTSSRFILDNKSIVYDLSDGVLTIKAETGLFLETLKRPDSVRAFTQAASDLGYGIRDVVVKELQPDDAPKRDIMELAKFPEVTIK